MDEAAHERERSLGSPAENPDVQEALSRAHSSGIVLILRLKSGRFAIFNNARELCGIVDDSELAWIWPIECWHPPAAAPQRQTIDLEELGLA